MKLLLILSLGNSASIIAIPSNGGIGIRLKNASETLTEITVKIALPISGVRTPCKSRILKAIPATSAIHAG